MEVTLIILRLGGKEGGNLYILDKIMVRLAIGKTIHCVGTLRRFWKIIEMTAEWEWELQQAAESAPQSPKAVMLAEPCEEAAIIQGNSSLQRAHLSSSNALSLMSTITRLIVPVNINGVSYWSETGVTVSAADLALEGLDRPAFHAQLRKTARQTVRVKIILALVPGFRGVGLLTNPHNQKRMKFPVLKQVDAGIPRIFTTSLTSNEQQMAK